MPSSKLHTIKPRSRAGSWETFVKRYQPIPKSTSKHCSTDMLEPDELPANKQALIEDNLLWTVVDCDGKTYVIPGWHYVDRLGYIICQIPFPEQELSNPGYVY